MITVSTDEGNHSFQSVDDVIKFLQTSAQENHEEVTFMAAGEEWEPDANAVISLNSAFSCIREFCATYERPSCIQWQEL